MNKEFEKIIEKLEIERTTANNTFMKYEMNVDLGRVFGLEKAIEIVKQELEKFAPDTNVGSNGWIPCSEKLPELRQDVLVTVRCTGFMGMYGYWIKTGHMEAENDWWGDCAGGEVIAWQPLPQPYHPKGE